MKTQNKKYKVMKSDNKCFPCFVYFWFYEIFHEITLFWLHKFFISYLFITFARKTAYRKKNLIESSYIILISGVELILI